MQVQHPRCTPVDGRKPPSKVSIPGHGNVAVDEEGYLDVENDAVVERAMSMLADAYDVEYTDDGNVVFEEDGPPDDVELPVDPSEHTVSDLEKALADVELSDTEREALLDAERDGKDRDTAIEAIEEA
jgi:hypothetical protein